MPQKIYSYQNFDIDVNGSQLSIIVWGIYIGIVVGVLAALLCRVYSGRIVAALLQANAADATTAKTLAELGLGKQFLCRYMLREDAALRRSVILANPEDYPPKKEGKPGKLDFKTARFYLPEEARIGAELRYRVEKHPIRNFVIAAVGLFAVAIFAAYAVPELLQMLDNFLTTVQPESKFL